MHTATTKIPHLLYEEDLLKTPKVMYDFIYSFVIFLLWIYMLGMGEKPRNIYNTRNKEKFPVWLPSHHPVYETGGRLFSGVRTHRKQAGPTLGGTGILL